MLALTYEAGFATVAEIKARLNIGLLDNSAVSIIQEMLLGASVAMEAVAGRPLLRRHAQIEYARGGDSTIRLQASPIAAIHSVRESLTRDFETSGNYEELVEGTDFVVEYGIESSLYGESGILRRLNGVWAGGVSDPGLVRIIYTGGYKTQNEDSLDNGTTTIQESALVDDFSIFRNDFGLSTEAHSVLEGSAQEISINGLVSTDERIAVVRFNLAGLILPSWKATSAVYYHNTRNTLGDATGVIRMFTSIDPLSSNTEAVFEAAKAGTQIGSYNANLTIFSEEDASADTDAKLAVFNESISKGFLAIALIGDAGILGAKVAAAENSTSSFRPRLVVTHRNIVPEFHSMPDDLRHACIIQVSHDFRTRLNPGLRQESARGVQVATGSSYSKDPAELLPYVRSVAEGYRRIV